MSHSHNHSNQQNINIQNQHGHEGGHGHGQQNGHGHGHGHGHGQSHGHGGGQNQGGQANNQRTHNHMEQCQVCKEYAGLLEEELFTAKELKKLDYSNFITGDIRAITGNKKKLSTKVVYQYFKDYMKCVFCVTFGFLTFGFFQHFLRWKLWLGYLSYTVAFVFIFILGPIADPTKCDHQVNNLLTCLMIYGIFLSSLIFYAQKVYENEIKMSDVYGSYFQESIDHKIRLKNGKEKKKENFLTYLDQFFGTFRNEIQLKNDDKQQYKTYFEMVFWNVIILASAYLSGIKPFNFIQLIVFQVHFAANLQYNTIQKIILTKRYTAHSALQIRELLKKGFSDKGDPKRILDQMQQTNNANELENLQYNAIKIFEEIQGLTEQIRLHLKLNFTIFKETRKIIGSTSVIFFITQIFLSTTLYLSNYEVLPFYIKKNKPLFYIYICYMLYNAVSIAYICFKKYSINNTYIDVSKVIQQGYGQKIYSFIEYYDQQINNRYEDIVGNDRQIKDLKGQLPIETQNNRGEILGKIEDLEGKNRQIKDTMKGIEDQKKPVLQFYADSVYKKAIIQDYVKANCERILYTIKVNSKIIWKFLWLVQFTTVVSVTTAG